MGLSESSLNTIMNSCSFYHTVRYHLIVLAVNIYVVRIIIASVIFDTHENVISDSEEEHIERT